MSDSPVPPDPTDAVLSAVAEVTQMVADVRAELSPPVTRPSAAEVARRRPPSAEPKTDEAPELVAITASGNRAPWPDAIEVFSRSFQNVGGTKSGKEYTLSLEVDGLHKLSRDSMEENRELISQAYTETQSARREERALTAAFCSPAQPAYGLFTSVSSPTAGAVSLPELEAPRGAVKVSPAPSVFSLAGDSGIGVAWNGVSSKTCASFDCEDAVEFAAEATYTCYSFPNSILLYHPERVAAVVQEARAAHAASVNAQLIAAIEDVAISYGGVGFGSDGGATVRIYQNLALAANWLRQKYQAPLDTFIDVLAPAWVAAVLEADLIARDSTNDPGFGLSRWVTSLRRLGIAIQFVYQYQEDLSSPAAPPTANMLMYFSGSVQRLRSRSIDIGPIHDTTTNAQNRAGFFFETWDGIATSGPEIVELVNVPTCPNGETAMRVDIGCEGS